MPPASDTFDDIYQDPVARLVYALMILAMRLERER